MPNGSYDFFDKALIVNWNYEAAHGKLTVSGTFNGAQMTEVILKTGTSTGEINGSSGGATAAVSLAANFNTNVLNMSAAATNPTRNGVGNSNF